MKEYRDLATKYPSFREARPRPGALHQLNFESTLSLNQSSHPACCLKGASVELKGILSLEPLAGIQLITSKMLRLS